MEWIVLDWNASAIRFYRRLGVRLDKAWVLARLSRAHVQKLARIRA
jgi:hypothetical protein